MLALDTDASSAEINNAYLEKLAVAAASDLPQLERAIAILSDPIRRRAYDARLRACCPPKKARTTAAPQAVLAATAPASTIPQTTSRVETRVQVKAQPATNGRTSVKTKSAQAAPRVGPKQRQQRQQRTKANQPPISGVGVFMGVLLVAALLAWWAMLGGRTSSANIDESNLPQMSHIGEVPEQAALEAKAVSAQVVEGVQTIDMVVIGDSMSYRPDVIKVKQGMPVRVNLTTEGRDAG